MREGSAHGVPGGLLGLAVSFVFPLLPDQLCGGRRAHHPDGFTCGTVREFQAVRCLLQDCGDLHHAVRVHEAILSARRKNSNPLEIQRKE